ncbi:disease resistance protein RPV1-like [Euphorbia lathyris]|uniref:disease resistance protein RPV1-like n=1 Tax=Euphorbia lathyris TaxID=212925 RepID=UPI003313820B
MASSTSDSAASRWNYDVFLSFGGNDIRKGFTGHLFAALCRSGINTFVDEKKLEYGEEIGELSLKGIKESRLALIILSRDYALSTWCLDELVQILKCKKEDDVWPIFYDVDPSDAEEIKGSYESAFVEHQKSFKEEIIKEWKDALQQVSYLKGLDLSNHFDGHEAQNIDHIVEEITRRVNPTMLNVAIHPVGLQSRVAEVISLMAIELEEMHVVGLYGMGGIGKSTIAKEVYNLIHHKFVSSCYLENVREVSSSKGIAYLQRQLLTEISGKKHEKIANPEIGLNVIVQKLCRNKVLVVLDDVDELDHVVKILGKCDWFFPGSRVIITTRIENFLNPSELYCQYEVDRLDYCDSLRLLSLHAFGEDHPDEDHVTCATKMLDYCGGIPLALEVLGSSLCGQSVAVWNSRLEKLKVIANDDIQSKLRTSYDSLVETEQFIFLDIACFFIGYNKEYVTKILDGCSFFPVQGIRTLIRRCLVKVGSNDKLVMHDLLRDMGRGIVRQENAIDPGERSRLWDYDDVIDVLTDKMGTNAVQGLALDKPGLEHTWNAKTFKKMKMLRLLRLNYVGLKGSYEYISNKLRWLCWREFPSDSIPSDLSLESLIVLDMRHSSLETFLISGQSVEKLKFLNLSHSHKLAEIPDFEGCRNLEKLKLKDCIRLEKIGDTIGLLTNLTFLTLEKCEDLRNLPGSIGYLKSLRELNLSHCSKLEVLPESFEHLSSLLTLNLQNCESLKSLPESIGNLESLEKLDMLGCSQLESLPEYIGHLNSLLFWSSQDCKNLKNFSSTIFGLRSLKELNMSGCSKLEELPEELGNLKSLAVLNLDKTGLRSLPKSIRYMEMLEHLSLSECPFIFSPGNSTELISILPYSVKDLDLRYCNIPDNVIPDDLRGFCCLEELKLCGNKFTNLPASIGNLPNLHRLYVNACEWLRSIPQLQSSLVNLQATDYFSLERIGLKNVTDDLRLEIKGSVNLKQLEGYFDLEPLEVEFAEKLVGSSIRDSIRNFSMRKIHASSNKTMPLQTLSERGIYSIFLPGSDVPAWFSHRNGGNIASLNVPRIDPGSTIIGVVTYATYAWKHGSNSCYRAPYITITNRTKMFAWLYKPPLTVFSSGLEQDISWMAYWIFNDHQKETDRLDTGWRFKDETEQGDQVEFSFDMGFGVSVKNSGIHLLLSQPDSFVSDELALICSATSKHHRRFTNSSPESLRIESNGDIKYEYMPRWSEEFMEWENHYIKRIAEVESMNKRVFEEC